MDAVHFSGHTHFHMHTRTHAHTCSHTWSYMHTHMHTHMHTLHAHAHAHIHAHTHAHTHNTQDGVEFIEGFATFTGDHEVSVNDRRLTAKHVVIATGAKPIVPDVPGAQLGITSDGFFELDYLPRCAYTYSAPHQQLSYC